MADPVARLVVYGTPGTAGSKSAFPLWRKTADGGREFVRTKQVEVDLKKVKANWREAILSAAQRLILDPWTDRIRAPFPLDEALVASMVFTVRKPANAHKTVRTWPATRPDVLKYARAAEDALQAAGVLKDDARVVEYSRLAKVFPGEDRDALDAPGVVITLWRMAELTMWQREAVVTPATADLSLFDDVADLRSGGLNPPGGVTPTPPSGAGGA